MAIDCTELAIADPVLLAAIRVQLEIPEGPISGEAALAVTESLASTLPAMCEHAMKVTWDLGSCTPEPGICDIPI